MQPALPGRLGTGDRSGMGVCVLLADIPSVLGVILLGQEGRA